MLTGKIDQNFETLKLKILDEQALRDESILEINEIIKEDIPQLN